jgi:hypothetical protein
VKHVETIGVVVKAGDAIDIARAAFGIRIWLHARPSPRPHFLRPLHRNQSLDFVSQCAIFPALKVRHTVHLR